MPTMTISQKPSVPEAVAAMMNLVAASEKLRAFITFLDEHKALPESSDRAMNLDMRNMASRIVVEIDGLMRQTEALAERDEAKACG
jgi:hypothetical protein